MAITVKNTTGVIDILTSDTIVHLVEGKLGVEAFNCHNTSTDDVVIEFFISPDSTSANGKRVDRIILAANEELDVNAIVGQGYQDTQRIIAKADVLGANCSMTYTKYTGDDI